MFLLWWLTQLNNWLEWEACIVKQLEVWKLPESKREKEQRSCFKIPNSILILSHSMFWFYDIEFEDENNLLIIVNDAWNKRNDEQEWNGCTEHHRHVNKNHQLRESPMSMELLSSVEADVILNWSAFSFKMFWFNLLILIFHRIFIILFFLKFFNLIFLPIISRSSNKINSFVIMPLS
jgi:hypothetical protein